MPPRTDSYLGALSFKLIVGLLLSTSCFMMKHLIDEQDKLKEIVWQLRQDVVVLKYTLDHMNQGKRSE